MDFFPNYLSNKFFTLYIFISSLYFTSAEKVLLFESLVSSPDQWNVRSVFGKTKNGWMSESGNVGGAGAGAQFSSCDLGLQGVQNFLVTPFIPLKEATAHDSPEGDSGYLLYYDIKYTIKSCEDMGIELCDENMRLGVVETESQKLLDMLQIGSAVQYREIDTQLREDDDPLSDSLRNVEITTSHYFQPHLQQKGLALVFEDNGACVSIASVQVYKRVCPGEVYAFALFPRTTAPPLPQISVDGKCVPHAVSNGRRPKRTCFASGTWEEPSSNSKCECEPGFSPDLNNSTQCRACPRNTFKSQKGEAPCEKCPQFSSAPVGGARICECDPGRFRFISNNPLSPCYTNPSAPRNLQTLPVSSENKITSVRLTWDPPLNDGSENIADRTLELWYSFTCDKCAPDVHVEPSKDGIRTRSVVITRLSPDTTYTFNVYSHNRINDVTSHLDMTSQFDSAANNLAFGEISYTTPKAIHVRNLQVIGENGVIKVDWMPPSEIQSHTDNHKQQGQDEKVNNNNDKREDDEIQNISYYYVRIRKRMMGGGNGGSVITANGKEIKNQLLPSLIHTHRNQKVPVNQTHVEFSGVDGGEYLVDVSTSGMSGPYCNPVSVHVLGIDDKYLMQRKVQRVVLTIILLALVFLLFLSIFMIALCFYRKKQRWGYLAAAGAAGGGGCGRGNRPSSAVLLHQNSLLNYVGMGGIEAAATMPWWGANHNHSHLTADLSQQEYLLFSQESAMKLPVGQRFVEPKIFDPPERILAEFTREIDPRAIQRYVHPTEADQTGRIDNQVKIWLNLGGAGMSGSEFGNYNCSQASSNSSSDLATTTAGMMSTAVAAGNSPLPKGAGLGQGGCISSNCVIAAAKTLKNHFTAEMWRKFAIEAATIAQFNHPNVVMIHGVITITEESPKMLILEFCERGSLDCLLSLMSQMDVTTCAPYKSMDKLTPDNSLEQQQQQMSEGQGHHGLSSCSSSPQQCNKTLNSNSNSSSSGNVSSQITHILRGVACGMHYLADEGYVHKVLRARNIFISGSLVPKIAGFDERTCLEEEMEMYFMAINSRSHYDMWPLPLVFEDIAPWTAPEALLPAHKFSCFSDSWSFGCLIWECFSLGERPFGQLNALDISNLMTNMSSPWTGFNKPKLCPQSLYELMCMCCSPGQVPHRRPWFNQIRELLDNVIRSNISLDINPATGAHNYQYVTGSRMTNLEQQKLAAKMGGDMHSMELSPTTADQLSSPAAHLFPSVPIEGVDIQELLISLRLEKYGENFKVHGYYTLSEVLAAIEMTALSSCPQMNANSTAAMGLAGGMDSKLKDNSTWTRCCQKFLKQIGIVRKKDRNLMVKKLKSFLFNWGDNYASFTSSATLPSPNARTPQYLHHGNL